ncbi:ABC transporter ATP-binding protein [Alsobacter sp. R-9]
MSGTVPLLEVDGLTVAFGPVARVVGLSFHVMPGETLAIVGESGSGKSLTALAVMQLLPRGARIAAGSVKLAGDDLASLPEPALRRIRGRRVAMVFQEPMTSLNPVMTVGDQIAEGLRLHQGLSRAAARRRAAELLDLVRVPDPQRRLDEFPHRLSGGLRQRVMIAMAVACGPDLLIADEPTTALDVTIQAQVLDLIDRLRRELTMAVLLITHDLGLVAQWADRVAVLYAGRQVEAGPATDIFVRPRHPYTAGLAAASPRLGGAGGYRSAPLAEIPGSIAGAPRQGCAFAPRCDRALPSCRQAVPPLVDLPDGGKVACPVVLAGAEVLR